MSCTYVTPPEEHYTDMTSKIHWHDKLPAHDTITKCIGRYILVEWGGCSHFLRVGKRERECERFWRSRYAGGCPHEAQGNWLVGLKMREFGRVTFYFYFSNDDESNMYEWGEAFLLYPSFFSIHLLFFQTFTIQIWLSFPLYSYFVSIIITLYPNPNKGIIHKSIPFIVIWY